MERRLTSGIVDTIFLLMLQCSKWRQFMRTHTKPHDEHSPLDILTELAVEGTSSLVEAQEAAKATSGKKEHDKGAKKTELVHLAREAGKAFIEAQKRLLDVMGQQMNVNLDATTRTLELMSPSRLVPMASLTGEGVRSFVDAETSLIGSLIKPPKKVAGPAKPERSRTVRQHKV